MAQKSIAIIPKKRRGRPATGKDPLIALRLPLALIKKLDDWAKENGVSRSAAVRGFIERGLGEK
jgi:predicted DNA-binding protein